MIRNQLFRSLVFYTLTAGTTAFFISSGYSEPGIRSSLSLDAMAPVSIPVTGRPDSLPIAIPIDSSGFSGQRDSTTRSIKPELADSVLLPTFPDSLARPSGRRDSTLKVKADSVQVPAKRTVQEILADSLNFTSDSTARQEQLTFKRPQTFAPDPVQDLRYNLFLKSPNSIKKVVDVDSTLSTVIIRETIGDFTLRGPVALPYDEYVNARYESNIQSGWATILNTRTALKKSDAIEELFSKITNVDIYVPGGGSGLFRTIFGPPRINIRVNGSIDVKAGWATSFNSINQSQTGSGTQNDPVFDQQFQMNVQGTVGDKLQITADWSTQRTFEYENSLRIVYTGYEDEIIQKIEAGNVSLSTPNKYAGGSAALFGIKSTMQMGPLTWTFLVSQQKGKTEKKSIAGGSQETKFEIAAWNYDYDRHFFISAYYRDRYESSFIPNSTVPINIEAPIAQFEVWKQKLNTQNEGDIKEAVALMYLGENIAPGPGSGGYGIPGGTGPYQPDVLEKLRTGVLEPANDNQIKNESFATGNFVKLEEGTDYILDQNLGIIHLLSSLEQGASLAIAYTTQANTQIGDLSLVSGGGSDNKLILKLIRPSSLLPGSKDPTKNDPRTFMWSMMLKNYYKLPGSDFKEDDLTLDVNVQDNTTQLQRSLPGSNNNLLDVLGLNELGPNNSTQKDDKFDFREGITVDSQRGYIVFPVLRPFDSDQLKAEVNSLGLPEADVSDFIFPDLYDTTQQAAKNITDKNRYFLVGTVKGSISNRYTLGAFNLVEGSVKVLSNGIPLTPNVDYEVDYQLGSLEIKNQAYLTAGSNLSIEYESNDLFTLASKNFMGSRFDLDLSEKLKLGFSWLRYSEKPLTDKVRIGEEPKLNNIIGMDGRWTTESRLLTRGLNLIPGVKTSQPSEITISGEVAQVLPGHPDELNTKLDPGGVAYIDDFEGSRKSITAGLNYTSWSLSSAPVSFPYNLPFLNALQPDSSISNYRAWLIYYNDYARRIPVQDIWPERSVSSRDNSITPFVLDYRPKNRGPFNFSTQLDQTIFNTNGETWAGIQKALPTYITNLVDENIEYLEFWVQVSDDENSINYTDLQGGNLYVDLGFISEDILPDAKLNTELGISSVRTETTAWGRRPISTIGSQFSVDDDLGLDGIVNNEEPAFFSDFVASLDQIAIDPDEKSRILSDVSGDNYDFQQGSRNFSKINGSEKNSSSQGNQDRIYPDSEDMNNSTDKDLQNNFFRYKVRIVPDSLKPGLGYVVSANETSKWYQIRIPLKEFTEKVGNIEDLSETKYIRLWLNGFRNNVYFQFATFDFVGNQWLISKNEAGTVDSVLSVAVINIEENPDKYNSPPGIQREKDRTRPDENIQLNEQSLELKVRNLEEGAERSVYKNISQQQGLNISNYKRLKMFVHGPDEDPQGSETPVIFVDSTNYDAEVFLRFGTNNKIFYELSLPLHPDRRRSPESPATWSFDNTFDIDLSVLTAFKTQRLAGNDTLFILNNPPGYPAGSRIRIRGNPTITKINQFEIGVRNPANKGSSAPLSFSIWVNELRVSGYREEAAWAANTSMGIKLADVGSVNFVIEKQEAEFRLITEPIRNNKSTLTTWSVNGSFGIEKFLNNNQEIAIPLTISHSESVGEPKYLSGSDIELETAAKLAGADGKRLIDVNRSVSIANSISLNGIKKVKPSGNSLLQATVDKLTLNFSYSDAYQRDPNTEWYRQWSWNTKLDYRYQFKPDGFIEPLSALSAIDSGNFLISKDQLTSLSKTKLYYKPRDFGFSFAINRSRSQTKSRIKSQADSPSLQFTSTQSFSLSYPLMDDLSLNMTGNTNSTLQDLLLDDADEERPESEVLGDLLKRMSRLDLGRDLNYNQSINLQYKVPFFSWATISTQYQSQYSWRNNNATGKAAANSVFTGNDAGWATSFSIRSTILLNSQSTSRGKQPQPSGRIPGQQAIPGQVVTDTTAPPPHLKLLSDLASIGKAFLALDDISINFSQQNRFQTGALAGQSGFLNFFPFNAEFWPDGFRFFKPNVDRGPGLLYQLGLTTNPGNRIPTGDSLKISIREAFSQTNTIDWRTGFKPFDNVKADFSWKVSWNYSKENTLNPNDYSVSQSQRKGGFSRSFIGIVGDFEALQKKLPVDEATGNYLTGNNEITNAFRDAFELFGLSGGIKNAVGLGIFDVPNEWQNLIPLPNWTVSISGLEKIPVWSGFIQTMTMTHTYTGDYSAQFIVPLNAGQRVSDLSTGDSILVPFKEFQNPRITEKFSPLVGFNMSFAKQLSARVNYNMGRTINLSTVNYQLSTQETREVQGSVNFSQSGSTLLNFWPFNGNTLKNDIDLSVTGSYSVDETTYETLKANAPTTTKPSGTTRITVEPRVGYAISSRVNASAFWRYTSSKPISGSISTAEISRSEIGVNIHISIQ